MKLLAEENPHRRRRSWYRRRLRIQRTILAFVLVLFLGGVGWQSVASFLAFRSRQISRKTAEPAWTRGDVHSNLTALAATATKPANSHEAVYPYSVIPGGIRDADDLERAAEHDRAVWEHYALFQYRHARLVRATEAREVYLSYRLRNHIYWTRKRIRLHVGELLITDGNITARTRCGNQISEQPKPEVSAEEPSEDILDQPVAQIFPAPALPMFSSLHTPSLPESASPPEPITFRGFIFPYVPSGIPIPPHVCKAPATNDHDGDDKPCKPHHRKPPVVPEPSTILLISSGFAAVYWQYRRKSQVRA